MSMALSTRTSTRRRAGGFTLIEILVTLFVIALGILGTAGLQAVALKISHSGQLRSQAVILGLDLLERIEANNPAAIVGNYAPGTLPTSAAKDCSTSFCLPIELATYDLAQFNNLVAAQLPGATATVTFAGAGPFTYTVQINWVERIAKDATTAVATTGGTVDTSGKTETLSYTVSKMFSNRAVVI